MILCGQIWWIIISVLHFFVWFRVGKDLRIQQIIDDQQNQKKVQTCPPAGERRIFEYPCPKKPQKGITLEIPPVSGFETKNMPVISTIFMCLLILI